MAVEIEQLIELIIVIILVLIIKFMLIPFYFENKKVDNEHELKLLKYTPSRLLALSKYKEASINKNDSKVKKIGKNMIKFLII